MSDTIDVTRAAFRTALESLLNTDIPDRVTVAWVSQHFGISGTSVRHAIKVGKLPAQSVGGTARTTVYLVRPEDALMLWGNRLTNQA